MKDPDLLLQEMDDIIDDLREASRNGPILVEGLRDAAALRALGVERNVEPLNTGRPLLERCEELARGGGTVTLLTDWDTKGNELSRRLREGLEREGAPVDVKVRARLRKVTRGSAYAVEELASFYRRVERATRQKGKPKSAPESWRVKKHRKSQLRAARQRRGAPRRSKR